jgi:predicted aldo/keto reductase-like oxidoreductase
LKILEAYEWDFCQIQYNYLDEHTQAGRKGLETAYEKHIPVIIMEPLRGGKLVNKLPSSAKTMIDEHENNWSAAEWAFRWLWNQPGVTCVLSGMNSQEMVEENIRIASEVEVNKWTQEEFDFIEKIKEKIKETVKVGCTGCGYCMPCPKGINIPFSFLVEGYFSRYNLKEWAVSRYQSMKVKPSACIECGICETKCPYNLPIRRKLKEVVKVLEEQNE